MRNLDITTLRSFIAIADHGGVTRAAHMLNLTQSAVSMQIKRLEDMLGQELLNRGQRKISLTPAGEQLLSYARRIIALNDELVTRLTDEHYEGVLRLGVPHDIIYPHIPQVLKDFASALPRVSLQLISSRTLELHAALEKGDVDVILTTEDATRAGGATGGETGGETLDTQPLIWVGTQGAQVWKTRPLPLAFSTDCLFKPIALQRLDAAGIDWSLRIDSDDERPTETLISADLAIGALLRDSIPAHLAALPKAAQLPELGALHINLYQRQDRAGMVPQSVLVDLLRRTYRAPIAA